MYIDIFFFLLEINLCVRVYLSGDVGIIFKYVDYDFKYQYIFCKLWSDSVDYLLLVGYVVYVCIFFRMWVKFVQEFVCKVMFNLYIYFIIIYIIVIVICVGSF